MLLIEFKNYLLSHGSDKVGHSGQTLWSHLQGVHRILVAAKLPNYLCVAGLFHSVYGTKVFKHTIVDKNCRAEVHQLIGHKAECLVWAFCELERPKIFETTLKPGASCQWLAELKIAYEKQQFFADLLALECANLAEQKTLYKFPLLAQHAQVIGILDREGFSV